MRKGTGIKIVCGIIIVLGLAFIYYLLFMSPTGYFYKEGNNILSNEKKDEKEASIESYNYEKCNGVATKCIRTFKYNSKTVSITKEYNYDDIKSSKLFLDDKELFEVGENKYIGTVSVLKDVVVVFIRNVDEKQSYMEAYDKNGKKVWTLGVLDKELPGIGLRVWSNDDYFVVDGDYIQVSGRRDYNGTLLLGNDKVVKDYCDASLLRSNDLSMDSTIEATYKIKYNGNNKFDNPVRDRKTSIKESGFCQ